MSHDTDGKKDLPLFSAYTLSLSNPLFPPPLSKPIRIARAHTHIYT